MNKQILLLIPFFAIALLSCNSPLKKKNFVDEKRDKSTTTEPEDYIVSKLPSELDEISGIIFINDSTIAAIEDETGNLYFYNLTTKSIIKQQRFAEDGDYEDLAIVGPDIYVTSSGGTLYQIKNFESTSPVIKKYDTPFTKKNDIESIAYDKTQNRILMAPKAEGLNSDETVKSIYAFDLKSMKFKPDQIYSIKIKEIEEYFKGDAITESSKKFLKAIGNENMNKVFRPSALTINPITKEIYVLSAVNNLISVLSPEGKLTKILSFDSKDFQQPEGIAFSPNGKLYVSNEKGKKGAANIIEIKYEKK